jgi:hypothetical protein
LLELALGGKVFAQERFLQQLENGDQFVADLTHFATLQSLYQALLNTLHLKTSAASLRNADFRYSRETLLKGGFIPWVNDNRNVLQGVLHLPSKEKLSKDPLRFISQLLQNLGLKQKRVGRAKEGVYQVDSERVRLLNNLLLRRKSGGAGSFIPLDVSAIPPKKETPVEFFVGCFEKVKRFFSNTALPLPVPI